MKIKMKTIFTILFFVTSIIGNSQSDTVYYGTSEFEQLLLNNSGNCDVNTFPINCNKLFNPESKQQFSGIICVGYKDQNSMEALAINSGCPVFKYYRYMDGIYLYYNEIGYYCDYGNRSIGILKYQKKYLYDSDSAYILKYYDTKGRLNDSSYVYCESNVIYQKLVRFGSYGDTLLVGMRIDGLEDGVWRCYYNNSKVVNEIWSMGKFIDVKNIDIIYLDRKHNIITKDDYFEIMNTEKNISMNVYPLSSHQLELTGMAFIFYFDQLNNNDAIFEKSEVFIENILKKYKEFYKK